MGWGKTSQCRICSSTSPIPYLLAQSHTWALNATALQGDDHEFHCKFLWSQSYLPRTHIVRPSLLPRPGSKIEHLGPFLADIQARAGKQVHSFTDRRSTIKAGSESKSNHSAGWQENYKRLLDFPRRNSMMS